MGMNSKPVVRSDGVEFESVRAAARAAGVSEAKMHQVAHGVPRKLKDGFVYRLKRLK